MKHAKTSRRRFIQALGLGVAAVPLSRCRRLIAQEAKAAGPKAPRPNLLIIFTDDQGYADLGCFGNKKNRTPRMDRLAAEGTRFTSFYAQAVCGPSRSALLTGRYPLRSKG